MCALSDFMKAIDSDRPPTPDFMKVLKNKNKIPFYVDEYDQLTKP